MRVLVVALLLLAGLVLTNGARMPRQAPARSPARVLVKWVHGLRQGRTRARSPSVAHVLVEVSTRLRAGAGVTAAWQRSIPEPPPPWAEPVLLAVGAEHRDVLGLREAGAAARRAWPALPRWLGWLGRIRRRPDPRSRADVAAAVAACKLAQATGAPLAEVVTVVVDGIAEAANAEEQRRTALAGPRASARLLAWLPVGGLALGSSLGANPVAVLLGGGVGGLCLIAGAALLFIGRRWVHALVADAERAGR